MLGEFFLAQSFFSVMLLLWVFFSIITWILFVVDKRKSMKNTQRISEKTLLLWSVAGSLGAIAGIYLLRHKTLHIYFPIVAIQSLLLEGIALYAIY